MRLAVLNLSRMGDILLSGPLLERLRELHPEAELHLIVPAPFADAARGLSADAVHPLDTDSLILAAGNPASLSDLYRRLHECLDPVLAIRFDAIYNLGYDRISAILAHLMDGPVAGGQFLDKHGYRRIAGEWAKMAMASQLARGMNPFHLADLHFGFSGAGVEKAREVRYRIPDAARVAARSLLAQKGYGDDSHPLIVIQTGASDPSKQWGIENYARLARLLGEQNGAAVVFTGSRGEVEMVAAAVREAGPNAINLAGDTDIPTLAAVLERACLVISNDTGTMHLAQAVGTRVLCLTFGNALSHETGPYGAGHLVLEPEIACFPCSFHVKCPHFNCHQFVTPELVTQLAADLTGNSVPDRYEFPGIQVRIWRTEFDDDGFWMLRRLDGLKGTNEVARDRYRSLLKHRLDLSPEFGAVEEPFELDPQILNRDQAGVLKLLDQIAGGERMAVELAAIMTTPEPAGQASDLAQQLDRLQASLLNNYLHLELLHPLLALFRFDLENLPDEDPFQPIRATQEALHKLGVSIRDLLRRKSVDLTAAQAVPEPAAVEPQPGGLTDAQKVEIPAPAVRSPYDRFRRPRCRGDHLTIILFENDYYLQREIREALVRLGHRVIPIRFLETSDVIVQLLFASLEADLLFTINHLGFDQHGALASLLEKIRLPYVSWFVDRPQYILLDHQAAPGEMAHVFSWERRTLDELAGYGFPRVEFLPLATDETVFNGQIGDGELRGPCWVANSMIEPALDWEHRANVRPEFEPLLRIAVESLLDERRDPLDALNSACAGFPELSREWTRGDRLRLSTLIAFLATREDRRRIAVACQSGLEIVGDEGWRQLAPGVTLRKQLPYGPELARYYSGSIQLNSTSFQMPSSLNQRVFDVPAAGGVLVTDNQDDLFDLFDAERECIRYRTPGETREKIEFVRTHPSEGRAIAAAARERILRDHTYLQRVQTLLGRVRDTMRASYSAERRVPA